MLTDLLPRAHAHLASLPLLGPHLDGFVDWLYGRGYPDLPIRLRLRKTPLVDAMLHRRGVRHPDSLTRAQLLELAPRDSQDDIYLSAVVRSLADYLDERGLLAQPAATPQEELVAAYRDHLDRVRGLADSTLAHHSFTASELLGFLGFNRDRAVLCHLGPQQVEAFVRAVGARVCRGSMQHTVAHLRSFLRFRARRGQAALGSDSPLYAPPGCRGA